ncbi:hypothetical protein GCM10012275_52940 [Longimycelium tulufanense]|uniref:HNH endonuclease n=1 Tax=Longimycelium tulufanense TaxID=907463 RepID=A0A8J3FWB3_9PSEU|nr:HNH endonuclease [Longimycelium tulufanense]GGM75653.1 hypothetical protein GCM10012275_52940 [Longimycelium tulufanense]
MPGGWVGSNRSAELPLNWSTEIRPAVLERDDYQCRWFTDGVRCTEPATDVDHVDDPHGHRPENLQSLCRWHHNRKSSAQGNAARRHWSTKRPSEPHPGLIG